MVNALLLSLEEVQVENLVAVFVGVPAFSIKEQFPKPLGHRRSASSLAMGRDSAFRECTASTCLPTQSLTGPTDYIHCLYSGMLCFLGWDPALLAVPPWCRQESGPLMKQNANETGEVRKAEREDSVRAFSLSHHLPLFKLPETSIQNRQHIPLISRAVTSLCHTTAEGRQIRVAH
ncbi:hypothetical protein DPX16_10251 [Anabarilius grahami]|uniref:Uncharacterized protein n=1 Tax=Anabarilius grahami TaxID=495550 RepID=A0A3N0Y0K6_ANAGA|nr:hypothetical protein DPX16_10251 [Anabarilius grahami]